MKRILFGSPHVPPEWIAAHRLAPCRILPGDSRGRDPIPLQEGVCPFLRGWLKEAVADKAAAGLVLTTTCDQTRRARDILDGKIRTPVFLFNIPATCESVESRRWHLSELQRLGRFLVEIGGTTPSPKTLAKIMIAQDDARAKFRAAQEKQFHARRKNIPLAIVGGPLSPRHDFIFKRIEKRGGTVVFDGTETGERLLPAPFDRRRLREKPLQELADAYFDLPDVFKRPNTALYKWLRREIQRRDVRGVILLRQVWCDLWHAEVARMREWLAIPLLDVALDDKIPKGQTESRVDAFLEALS